MIFKAAMCTHKLRCLYYGKMTLFSLEHSESENNKENRGMDAKPYVSGILAPLFYIMCNMVCALRQYLQNCHKRFNDFELWIFHEIFKNVNPFYVTDLFLYPSIATENLTFSGGIERPEAWNDLKILKVYNSTKIKTTIALGHKSLQKLQGKTETNFWIRL